MCNIYDIQQQIDSLKQEKAANDEVISGIVAFLRDRGNEYIKYFFMKTDNTFQIPHKSFQIMEKIINLNGCNYHLYALWNRYYNDNFVEIFLSKAELNNYIVANTSSYLDDKG